MHWKNKVVIITGATSGIGEATANGHGLAARVQFCFWRPAPGENWKPLPPSSKAAEVADDGIDVISVCPGRVKTSFQENVLQNVIREDRSGGISAERVAEAILKASRRRKRLVVVPAYLKWGIAVANALPALKEWGRRQMWRRAAKKDA